RFEVGPGGGKQRRPLFRFFLARQGKQRACSFQGEQARDGGIGLELVDLLQGEIVVALGPQPADEFDLQLERFLRFDLADRENRDGKEKNGEGTFHECCS